MICVVCGAMVNELGAHRESSVVQLESQLGVTHTMHHINLVFFLNVYAMVIIISDIWISYI